MITKISSDAMIFRLMPEQRAWKELNYENLKWNVEKLKEHLPEHCAFMAVVKADAYGHGALPVSSYLNRIGVRAFAVATLQEGIALRKAGIQGEILIMGYTPPPGRLPSHRQRPDSDCGRLRPRKSSERRRSLSGKSTSENRHRHAPPGRAGRAHRRPGLPVFPAPPEDSRHVLPSVRG